MKLSTSLAALCVLALNCVFAQNYFEQKLNKMDGMAFYQLFSEGASKFDYTTLREYTFVLPAYDPNSTFFTLAEGTTYSSLASEADRKSQYEISHLKSYQQSTMAGLPIQFMEGKFEDLSDQEKESSLFFSYCTLQKNYYYLIVWFSPSGGEPLPMMVMLANDIDVSQESELRFMFNILGNGIQKSE